MSNDLIIQPYRDVIVVNFQNISVVDSDNIEIMGRGLMDLVEKQDHRKIILDFSAVRFLSSQALGVLIQMKKSLDTVRGQMLLVGLKPDLAKVFKITNLHKVFKFFDALDKALAEFNVYMK
jgi:anti-anti-sigma factor